MRRNVKKSLWMSKEEEWDLKQKAQAACLTESEFIRQRIAGYIPPHQIDDEVGFFEGSIKEETPCNPTTPYGISKNSLRELTDMLCKQKEKEYQWFRGYYIVGNSKFGSSIFSKITAAEEEGKKEFPFTQGLNQFDFIDYDDFCEQVASAICQNKTLGVINICSGRPEKLSDRVERFIKENGYNG